MTRGWHYAKLSLSNAPRLFFFLACVFCYSCSFLLSFLLLELGRCSSDLFLSSRPRTGLATTYINSRLCELRIDYLIEDG